MAIGTSSRERGHRWKKAACVERNFSWQQIDTHGVHTPGSGSTGNPHPSLYSYSYCSYYQKLARLPRF